MANRWVTEVPNRIYRALEPKLNTQLDGKGSFDGGLIIETQPELADSNLNVPLMPQKILTILSQLGFVVAALLFYVFANDLVIFINEDMTLPKDFTAEAFNTITDNFSAVLVLFFAWITVCIGASVMQQAARYFWGEIQLSSLLMFMIDEGTFTESRFSTGMSIHDSTRSENTLVRSSITPWIITIRVNCTIFADSVANNLSHHTLLWE